MVHSIHIQGSQNCVRCMRLRDTSQYERQHNIMMWKRGWIDQQQKKAWCLRLNARLENKFYEKVVSGTCYLIDMSLRAALDGKVAEEVWTGNEVDYFGLRVFGCPTYAHIYDEERSKLDAKSPQCIF